MNEQSWDASWEQVHKDKEWGKYPPEELVRFIARNFYAAPDRSKVHILDLGCGGGSALWYMAREGFSAHGIDGSKTAITLAQKRLTEEGLSAELRVGDIVTLDYPDATFDGAIDMVSIHHNTPENMKKIVAEVLRILKPGGKFLGQMIAADQNAADVSMPNWAGVIYYSKLEEVQELFKQFSDVRIEYMLTTQHGMKDVHKFWFIHAVK